jgi:hypothetical protein
VSDYFRNSSGNASENARPQLFLQDAAKTSGRPGQQKAVQGLHVGRHRVIPEMMAYYRASAEVGHCP